jgi:Zn-dependent protease
MEQLNLVQKVAIFALPVLFAITLHEAAHGYVARYFGDMTADAAGRISLNPLRHIDLFGTILMPILTLLLADILFGWAKPVPVNFAKLRHPKRDMLWVAAAGPLSNLAMALVWAFALPLSTALRAGHPAAAWLAMAGAAGVFVNVIFMVLNLLPLPPLDGGRIVMSLLPHRLAWKFARVERFGFLILMVLLVTGMLDVVLWPLIVHAVSAIAFICGIAPADLFQMLKSL